MSRERELRCEWWGEKCFIGRCFRVSEEVRKTGKVPSTQSTRVGTGLLSGSTVAASRDNDNCRCFFKAGLAALGVIEETGT